MSDAHLDCIVSSPSHAFTQGEESPNVNQVRVLHQRAHQEAHIG
jgi:hypothetical protein